MTTLGSYNHDFPRLAKQSGYFFQLYRGRVNWTDIENLNIDEIVETRNFNLLEQNLVNVINCNLEREYDLKILDQKFVKLFKLAQLGVDYLSYCEMYLDRCVVLLQEQLLAFQEECELLKQENHKKSEELKKYKKKIKVSNYQCEKCEKVFISDIYLKYHDKRRHSNPATPKSLDRALSAGVSTSQQTEDEKITISTQTLIEDEIEISKTNEMSKIIKENDVKIENLGKELEDLKTRLIRTESSLNEKTETLQPTFQSPFFYPQIVPFMTPYAIQPSCFDGYNYQAVTECPAPQNQQHFVTKFPTTSECREEKVVVEKEQPELLSKTKSEIKVETRPVIRTPVKPNADSDKENKNPKSVDVSLTPKPIPLPRKPKRKISTPVLEPQTIVEAFVAPESTHSGSDIQFSQVITCSSTPVKETKAESKEILSSIEPDSISVESLNLEDQVERKKSFIKRIVSKKTPKLQELSKNLRRSLNNLCDSVSITKNKEMSQYAKSDTIMGLNNQLRELGVDPEWSGIPKKTMKQKLKALKHQRKLIAKENPMYPSIRRSIEKTISKKIVKNPFNFNFRKEATNKDTNEQESIETQNSSKPEPPNTTATEIIEPKIQKSIMYDIESESDSEISLSEPLRVQEIPEKEEAALPKKQEPDPKLSFLSESESEEVGVTVMEKEFDFSVFQVTKPSPKLEIPIKELSVDEIQTDFDFDDDFLEEFDSPSLKEVAEAFEIRHKDKMVAEKEEDKIEVLLHEEEKKDELEFKSNQSKPQLNARKKVLFADHLNDPDDDLWSLKSSWDTEIG